ncbi:hypothetical protein [Nocardioides taihuensis]|uniref:XRE family transcriptional regulator n=1 Tax=Nocardioides taihuensis TaxID=1835606 RepID=A0ABW0BJN2_9ACTN
MATTGIRNDTHAETIRLDIHEVVRQLNSHLGPTLVATLANVRDSKLPHKWAKADGNVPRPESMRRLLAAHRIWSDISNADSDTVARAWFIGANPRLGEISPIMALREGDERSALAAAKAFVEGTDD